MHALSLAHAHAPTVPTGAGVPAHVHDESRTPGAVTVVYHCAGEGSPRHSPTVTALSPRDGSHVPRIHGRPIVPKSGTGGGAGEGTAMRCPPPCAPHAPVSWLSTMCEAFVDVAL